jgi:hypothetical protein
MSRSQALLEACEVTLPDLVDRAIDLGGILTGDITIAVADIDLIYLRLQVLLASAERIGELRVERDEDRGTRGARGSHYELDIRVAGRTSAARVRRPAASGRGIRRKRHEE